MKTTYKYLLLAGLVVLAASCEKEIEKESPADATTGKMITETISAQIDDATKATVDADAKFAWTVGDNIAVHVSNGTYVTSGGASAAAASASFTVSYPAGFTRDAFAIFPSNIVAPDAENYGQAGHTLDVTLPSTYTLEQVSGTATPCPMIATNTPGAGWTFSQLCGLLRVTLNNLPPSTKSVTIDFNGKKVQGAFSIASPYSTIVTDDATGTDDIITINTTSISAWTDGLDVNIPIPVGTYTKITVTSWTAAGGTGTATLTMTRPIKVGSDWTVSRSNGLKVTASLPVFTVADEKKVIFAPGNLQAVFSVAGTSCTWKFADNQYDSVGNDVANTKVTAGGVSEAGIVDLFGWVGEHSAFTGLAQYGIHNSATVSEYGNNAGENLMHDWGELIGDGNTWHTPSMADWECLLNSRSGSTLLSYNLNDEIIEVENGRHARGYLMGTIHGLYIFPDKYVHPVTKTLAGVNQNNMGFWDLNRFTLEEWEIMEAAGVVFLPITGYRVGTPNEENKNVVLGVGGDTNADTGYYWSSTACTTDHAYNVYFGRTIWRYNFDMRRWLGSSVRLVRDIN